MNKIFLFSIFLVCTVYTYAQDKNNLDYIITLKNDTIYGRLNDKNYFNARNVYLTTDNKEKNYYFKKLKELRYCGETYKRNYIVKNNPKQDTIYIGKFLKPIIQNGNIWAYQKKKSIILRRKNTIFLRQNLKYYADDYFETTAFLDQRNNNDSLINFINSYNNYRHANPESKSFAEKNLHNKPAVNPQACLNFMGIVPGHLYFGFEYGVNKILTLSPRLSILRANIDSTTVLLKFVELSARCYFLDGVWMQNDYSTYKYSGINFSLTYMHPIDPGIIKALRFEFGYKQVFYNNVFIDYNLGGVFSLYNDDSDLLLTVGFGYSF